MLHPATVRGIALLFEPIQAVAVAAAVDQVHFAVVVHVVADDGKSGFAQVPFRAPFPLVVICVNVLEPAMRHKNVNLAVAIDIRHTDAVTVLIASADVVDLWLGSGKIDPHDTGMSIMREREIGLAIAIDVGHPATLGFERMGDEMALPHHVGLLGIFIPPQTVGHPTHGDDVRCPIVIDVDGPLATIGNELTHQLDGAVLMALPFASLRARVLIPVGTAENVGQAVAVHIERGDALGVIVAELMDEISSLRNVAGSIPASFIELGNDHAREQGQRRESEADGEGAFHSV